MKAAFGGYLGKEMKDKAKEFADHTPNIKKLPEHKKNAKDKKPTLTQRMNGLIKG